MAGVTGSGIGNGSGVQPNASSIELKTRTVRGFENLDVAVS
jgi:hypothetical protein